MSDVPSASPADDLEAFESTASKSPLAYLLSLPERVVRTGTGILGGVARESASLLVPRSFQSSRVYTVMVQQMLDFLVHDVGGVASGQRPSSTAEVDNYVARKAVGNFVDLASMATLHLSPVLVLAAVSDLAYGSQVYLKELAAELEAQGVIESAAKIHHVGDLLTSVSNTSSATSQLFNTPPLSIDALRETIDETRAAIRRGAEKTPLPTQADVDRLWQQMREISRREGVGLLTVSTAATLGALGKFATIGRGAALSSVKVAGSLFDKHVLDHYATTLDELKQKGLYASLAETSGPYIAAVWTNFQPTKSTLTEDVVSGKLLGDTWRAARRWLGRGEASSSDNSASEPDP
jgi:hypothetical protein